MKTTPALIALVLAAGLAACSPDPEVPTPGPLPGDPPVETTLAEEATARPQVPLEADEFALTAFTPTTNEIYCSFYKVGEDGQPSDRLFITEIAGVPAPAHVGLQNEGVALTEVSKSETSTPQVWIYRNDGRGFEVELNVTETAKGFESRDYEGTIQVTDPPGGELTAITGTCGV